MLSLFHKRCHFTRFVVLVGGGRIIVSSFIKSVLLVFFVCLFFWLLLSGGFENFHSQYPELCTEVKTIDQSGSETEKRVSNHSEKLSHHKPDYDQVWKHPLAYNAVLPTISPTGPRGTKPLPVFFLKLNLKRYIHTGTLKHADIREFYFWHIKTFSQLTYDIIWPSLLPGLFIKTAWCPADIRTPHRKDSLSSLTFLLLFPLAK